MSKYIKIKGGFTLVELLVVISIIALLLSILMPSLGRARAQAQSVVCLSQMKQIGSAMMMYALDAGDKFPPYDLDMQQNKTPYDNWCFVLAPYLGGIDKAAAVGKQAGDTGVFLCPTHKGGNNPKGNVERSYMTNISEREPWNVDWKKEGGYGIHRWKFSKVKRPADIAGLFDIQWKFTDYRLPLYRSHTGTWAIQYNQSTYTNQAIPPGKGKAGSVNDPSTKPETAPHSTGSNFATNVTFMDGHATKVMYQKKSESRDNFPVLPEKMFYFD